VTLQRCWSKCKFSVQSQLQPATVSFLSCVLVHTTHRKCDRPHYSVAMYQLKLLTRQMEGTGSIAIRWSRITSVTAL